MPSGFRSFVLEFISDAPPERVFDLLADAPRWPTWFGPARRVRWLSGRPAGGAGAVRLVRIGPVTVREEIVDEVASSHHAYSICSVIPVRDHCADVWLTPSGAGTHIRWETRFAPLVPGTGAMLEALLRAGLNRLGGALVSAAAAKPSPRA